MTIRYAALFRDGVEVGHFNPEHDNQGRFASGGGGGENPHALKMNDGAVVHSEDGHYAALMKAFEQGYRPSDIAAVGDMITGRFRARTDASGHFNTEIRVAWREYRDSLQPGYGNNFNPNHDNRGEFAPGSGGGSLHVQRGTAMANETIGRYASHPGPASGDGETRQTEAGMRAWKSTLEAAGFTAEYQRGSGFSRYGHGGARGTGLAMYSITWRKPA